MKIKRFVKQMFCRHEYPFVLKEVVGWDGQEKQKSYVVCVKCGKVKRI